MVSHLNKSGKKGPIWIQSRCLDGKPLTPRIRRINWRAHPSRSTKMHTTRTRSFFWRLLVQRSSWPTYRMAILAFLSKFLVVVRIRMELEVSSQFSYLLESLFFVTGRFRLQSIAIHCNRRKVKTDRHHTTFFSCTFARLMVWLLTAWLKTRRGSMCVCARFIPSSCHPWCVFELCWSSFCPSPVSLRLLSLLFHTLLVLCPALHLQCRQRRGFKPLHSRRMRSIAPWRYTILSH